MIKHIVMFKLKEISQGRDRQGNIAALKGMLEELPPKIEEIGLFEVGVNNLQAAVAYDLVLVSEFESLEALHRYQKNPLHQRVLGFVNEVCESRAVVDYAV